MTEPADPLPHHNRDPEELLYDFFKHMTSLSLITLGGVLTISQLPSMNVRPFPLVMVVVLLATAGIAAFAGMDEIVKARFDRQNVSRRIRFYRRVCPASFGLGVGGFLSLFFNGLS